MTPTRAELIRRGVVVDLMKAPWRAEVERAGYRLPAAMQREVFDLYVATEVAGMRAGPDAPVRLRRILQASAKAAHSGSTGAVTPFAVSADDGDAVQLVLSIRELADGLYLLISLSPLIRYLVVEDGVLRVESGTRDDTRRILRELLPGGVDGVPLPSPSSGVPVLGYCDAQAFDRALGANCYVLGIRHPIPGPIVIFALDGDDHGSLSATDASEFTMRALPGRPLPTLWVEGYQADHDCDDPAVGDPYLPGQPFEPPPAVVLPMTDAFLAVTLKGRT